MPTDELTLTPDDARRLLRQAAGTIEVSASPTDLPSRRRRPPRWLQAIAAAAAVLVIASGALVWRALSPDSPPPPSSPPTETTGARGAVPSVFGYSREDAVTMLEDLGFEVSVREVSECSGPGRALLTDPRPGTTPSDGAVELVVAGDLPASEDCATRGALPLSWALIDFATGRDDASEIQFDDRVRVITSEGEQLNLTAAQASDPDTWGPTSALGMLAMATQETVPSDGGDLTPHLTNTIGVPAKADCATSVGVPGAANREALSIQVGFPGNRCPTTLDVYFSGPPNEPGSRIDLIVATSASEGDVTSSVVPTVIGLDVGGARSALLSSGFAVHVERIPACDPRGVLDQAPRAGTRRPMGSTVTISAEVPRRAARC